MCSTCITPRLAALLGLLGALGAPLPSLPDAAAQDTAKVAADSAKARARPDLGPMRTIEFDTEEGTWANLDVSPDGKTILLDLLGDLYTLPVDGGEATLLMGGRDW